MFSQCRPVIVNFSPECDAFVEKKFRDRKRAEAERARTWELRWKDEQAKREQERLDRLKAHPRYEEWDGLSSRELERLVWSMPTTKIAVQFGVSDSAIGKRCRSAGIKKPHRQLFAEALGTSGRYRVAADGGQPIHSRRVRG